MKNVRILHLLLHQGFSKDGAEGFRRWDGRYFHAKYTHILTAAIPNNGQLLAFLENQQSVFLLKDQLIMVLLQ